MLIGYFPLSFILSDAARFTSSGKGPFFEQYGVLSGPCDATELAEIMVQFVGGPFVPIRHRVCSVKCAHLTMRDMPTL